MSLNLVHRCLSCRHHRCCLLVLVLLASWTGGQQQPRPGGGFARQGVTGISTPTLRLPQGNIVGREAYLSRTQKVFQYLGIPYAQPPLGELRFAAPVTEPLPSWGGLKNVSVFAPSCPQMINRRKLHERLYLRLLPQDLPDPGVSEDCLYLNIYVPDSNRPPEGWPVMVWFHGGDFNTGSPHIWDASIFVTKQKVIVVTVAYRLNILGFFTTTDAESPGNYGLLDQRAALSWVKDNIAIFDGNPSNIMIFGHSSGAISVGLHMMSPRSKGMFHKAIAMSGDAINSVKTPQEELAVVDQVAETFGCYRHPSDLMECLRNVEVEILIRESSNIESWGPVLDADINNSTEGPFLPKHPRLARGPDEFNAVPLIAGFTNNEQALAYIEMIGSEHIEGRLPAEQFEELIREEAELAVAHMEENSTCELRPELISDAVMFFYKPYPPTRDAKVLRDKYLDLQTEKNYAAGLTQLAQRVSSHSSRSQAYVYRFDYRARTPFVIRDVPDWAGVPHMFELPFVWGLPHSGGNSIQWNSADKKMADIMMSMYSAFARSNNPSVSGIKWEPYQEKSPGILIIDRNIDMSDTNAVDYKALAFWNDYYPTVLDAAMNSCCNVSSSAVSLVVGTAGQYWYRTGVEVRSPPTSVAVVLTLTVLRILELS